MFEKCELYYCDGLILTEEQVKDLNIEVTDNIGLIALIQKYNYIFEIKDENLKQADKRKILESVLNNGQKICCIKKENVLVLPPIKIYYGIKQGSQFLAFWDDEKIRDAKLSDIRINGIRSVIEDMTNSQELILEYKKQLKLRKVNDSLKNLN